ncbi:MAG: TfoX/Sxy family protein [Candidatus Andersenbacteria bacterium]
MATEQGTIDYLLDQASRAGTVTARRMFGEYAVYLNGKVVAFVCDDELFIKPTEEGKEFLKEVHEAPPYPGAKMYFQIPGDLWEDRDYLAEIFQITAEHAVSLKKKRKA